MRWILALMLCLLPLADVRASGPDDQFVELYTLIQQADGLNQSGQFAAATDKYQKAQNGLKALQGGFPNWNKDVVQFRLDYVTEKLGTLSKGIPRPAPVTKPVVSAAELERQVNELEQQVQALAGEKSSLERKLKESLAVVPAAMDPRELSKAEARITALQKNLDLLRVSLEQEKIARAQAEKGKKGPSESELSGLQAKAKKADDLANERDALRRKLDEAAKEVAALKARRVETPKPSTTTDDPATLRRKLDEANKEISVLKALTGETPKSNDAELANLRAKANQADDLAQERDALRGKLANANKEITALQTIHSEPPKSNDAELAGLRAKAKKADDLAFERDALRSKLDESAKEIASLHKLSLEPPKPDAELASLRAKLKEADAMADERASLRSKLTEANKEIAVLKKQSKSSIDSEVAHLKQADAEKKLEDAWRDLDALKGSRREEIRQVKEAQAKDFNSERDALKKKLASITTELAVAEARGDEGVKAARNELTQQYKNTVKERDALADKLKITENELASLKSAQPPKVKSQPAPAESNKKIAQLQARLAVLEANPVPYTAEELALFKKPAGKIAATPPTAPNPPHAVHSMKDLPPGAGALMADAQRAFLAHDYEKAENVYRDVLRQDDKNVYVLAHLANAQFANGQAEDCEKTVREVIALDPNDPAGLYLMGNLRLRQGKLDEALDALSRSAQINPTNSVTQNSLGSVLSQKGQRKAAETALRKALLNDPDYADAHHNLAIVYITENPPALELARFHYKKAVDLGHPKDSDLEKLLEEKK